MKRRKLIATLVPVFVAAFGWSAEALARESERTCGMATDGLGMSVVRGGLVVSRSNSIAAKVVAFLGENFSHSMLSHGPGGMVTTSNMYSRPGENNCTNPLDPDEIRKAAPGATRMSNAGNFASLFLMSDADSNAVEVGAKVNAVPGAASLITDFFERRVCQFYEGGYCRYKMDGSNFTVYSLFQYSSSESSPDNDFGANLFNGAVCSTLLAGGQFGALNSQSVFRVANKTYTMVDPEDESKNAVRLIYDVVYDRCMDEGIGWLSNVWCLETDSTLCKRAARQVASVFVNGSGSSGDSDTQELLDNEVAATAQTISPQGLATLIPSSTWRGTGSAPFTPIFNATTGASYGCWGSSASDLYRGWTQHPPKPDNEVVRGIGGGAGGVFANTAGTIDAIVGPVRPKIYRLSVPNGWTSWGYPAGDAYFPTSTKVHTFSDSTGAAWAFFRPESGNGTLYRKASVNASWTTEITNSRTAWAVRTAGNYAYGIGANGQLYEYRVSDWEKVTCGAALPSNAGTPDQMGEAGGFVWLMTSTGMLFRMTLQCGTNNWVNMTPGGVTVKSLGIGPFFDSVWIADSGGRIWNYDSATNLWYKHAAVGDPNLTGGKIALDMKARVYFRNNEDLEIYRFTDG